MSITSRILAELANGPATRYELAERIKAGSRYLENTLVSLKGEKRISVVGNRIGENGRSTRLYALPGYQAPQVATQIREEPVCVSEPIAGGEYAMATRRQFNGYAGYPGGSSHRGGNQ